ncbi:unnamed protein product [Spodoptera exigua]|nr:unnamed protein product [Spodoptera exigua]
MRWIILFSLCLVVVLAAPANDLFSRITQQVIALAVSLRVSYKPAFNPNKIRNGAYGLGNIKLQYEPRRPERRLKDLKETTPSYMNPLTPPANNVSLRNEEAASFFCVYSPYKSWSQKEEAECVRSSSRPSRRNRRHSGCWDRAMNSGHCKRDYPMTPGREDARARTNKPLQTKSYRADVQPRLQCVQG